MAYEIRFDDPADGETSTFFLCSVGTWADFIRWVDSLKRDYASLKQLTRDGRTSDTFALADDLATALVLSPPEDEGVLATAEALAAKVLTGSETESATILGE